MQILGVCDTTVKKDGSIVGVGIDTSNFSHLGELATGKHEFRLTSASASITVATRSGNDGEIVAIFHPKSWMPASVTAMKSSPGMGFRYVSSQAWSVSMTAAGDWVATSGLAGALYLGGFGLEKDTKVSVLLRGHIQFR